MNWISVKDQLPPENCGFILITNNINARSAFDNMSHIWMSLMLHKQDDGRFSAFAHPSLSKVEGITHWSLAAPVVANGAADSETNLKMIELIADDFEGGINFVQVSEEETQYASAGDAHQAQAVQELRGAVAGIRAAIASAQQAAPRQALTDERKAGPFWDAIQRACGELPFGYEVRLHMEKDAGCVEWSDPDGNVELIDGEGFISDDINEAIDAALASIPTAPEA